MTDAPSSPKLKDVFNEAKRQFLANGGWRLICSGLVLWLYACSLFLLVVAPYELWLVYVMRDWPAVPAHVRSVRLVPPPFHEGQSFWEFRFTRDDNGAELITADVRPGDFPFSMLGWSTTNADAARYHVGDAVKVYVAPDGRKFFPEQGSPMLMEFIIAGCLGLWVWVAARIVRRKITTSN